MENIYEHMLSSRFFKAGKHKFILDNNNKLHFYEGSNINHTKEQIITLDVRIISVNPTFKLTEDYKLFPGKEYALKGTDRLIYISEELYKQSKKYKDKDFFIYWVTGENNGK